MVTRSIPEITLLDVPRLNNGEESLAIKMCLYRRLITMRNTSSAKKGGKYELADNQRTIRYDYVYALARSHRPRQETSGTTQR